MPHDALGYACSPGLACSINAPKHAAFDHASRYKPRIDLALDPVRDGHRPDVPPFANQIHNRPVTFPSLKVGDLQFSGLSAPQAAPQEDTEESPISLAFERAEIGTCKSAFA